MEETVKKIEKVVPFGAGTAKMTIFEEHAKKAIERGWESLYYAENSMAFASLETEHETFDLVTSGHVSIVDIDTDVTYTNEHQVELEELLDRDMVDGQLPESKYSIDNTNWFVVILYEETETGSGDWQGIEDVTFEDLPTSMEELETAFLEHATRLLQWTLANQKDATKQ
jgi:hypothetical protein